MLCFVFLIGAYGRWDVIYPDVKARILSVESAFQRQITQIDQQAIVKYEKEGPAAAVAFTTQHSVQFGDALVAQWGQFFGELFMKYRDGYKITVNDDNQACGCAAGNAPYSAAWNNRIVQENGAHFRIPAEGQMVHGMKGSSARSASKLDLLNRR